MEKSGNSIIGTIVYCIIVFLILYFAIIRPNKKRIEEFNNMTNNLKTGDTIIVSGIYGKIKAINNDVIDLEISKDLVVKVNKKFVSDVVKD